MPAKPKKAAKLAPTPHAEVGAHHGPASGPGASETLSAVVARVRQSKALNYKILGLIVIAAVGVFVWRYMASVRASNVAAQWIQLDEASSVEKLDAIAKTDADSVQGKLAKLYVARYWLGGPGQGLDGLQQGDPELRKKAIEQVVQARESFKHLAEVFKNDVSLSAQAYLGAAEAEEALVGIPQEGKPLDFRGTVEKAAELYEQVARVAGTTPWGETAKKRAELLKQKANDVKELQSHLYNAMTPRAPVLDQSPPAGPGPGPGFSTPPLSFVPGAPGLPGSAPVTPEAPAAPKVEPGPPPAKADLPPRTPDPSVAPILPAAPAPPKK